MKVKEVSFKPGTLSPAESRRSTAVNRFPDDFSPGPVSLERKGVKYAPVLVPGMWFTSLLDCMVRCCVNLELKHNMSLKKYWINTSFVSYSVFPTRVYV